MQTFMFTSYIDQTNTFSYHKKQIHSYPNNLHQTTSWITICHFAYKYTLNIHFLVAFPIIVYANHHKISTNDIEQSSLVKHKIG